MLYFPFNTVISAKLSFASSPAIQLKVMQQCKEYPYKQEKKPKISACSWINLLLSFEADHPGILLTRVSYWGFLQFISAILHTMIDSISMSILSLKLVGMTGLYSIPSYVIQIKYMYISNLVNKHSAIFFHISYSVHTIREKFNV